MKRHNQLYRNDAVKGRPGSRPRPLPACVAAGGPHGSRAVAEFEFRPCTRAGIQSSRGRSLTPNVLITLGWINYLSARGLPSALEELAGISPSWHPGQSLQARRGMEWSVRLATHRHGRQGTGWGDVAASGEDRKCRLG